MAKRMLNMTPKEMTNVTKEELIAAIAGSEGRVLASETIGITLPVAGGCDECGICGIHGSRYDPAEYV